MEEENKIETVNEEKKSSGLETASFVLAFISAALNLFFSIIELCFAEAFSPVAIRVVSVLEILVYAGALVVYVISKIDDRKIKIDLTLILLIIATVMVF